MSKKYHRILTIDTHKVTGRPRLTMVDGLTQEQATDILLGAVAALNPHLQTAAEAVFADDALADQLYAILDANDFSGGTDV